MQPLAMLPAQHTPELTSDAVQSIMSDGMLIGGPVSTSIHGRSTLPSLTVRYQIKYHRCNLDCPYCIASWTQREIEFDALQFSNIMARIKELPYAITLRVGVGGEFFTSRELMEQVRSLCNEENNIVGVSFSTNLVADWDVIERFIDSTTIGKLGMGCTLHDTVIKSVDEFFAKVEKLHKRGVALYVGYVAIPQRIEYIRQYRSRCEEIGVPLIMNGLIGELQGVAGARSDLIYPYAYTDEEKRQLKELWCTPHSYNMLVNCCTTKGMQCSAGRQYIYIENNGDVSPCGELKDRVRLGNILDGTFALQEEDTLCPMRNCLCGNENQALRIVDRYYDRTHVVRIFNKKEHIPLERLYEGYGEPIRLRERKKAKSFLDRLKKLLRTGV
jgi:MoaA/NifB/PqqE/SkfB family radical SAM enzyme